MLHEHLLKVAKEYSYERVKKFSGSDFANFVRKDLVTELKKHLLFNDIDYKCQGSVGQGQWASVPWLAIFDRVMTETATKGVYIVYLVNPINETVSLSLNQGTTSVYQQFGETRGREVLARRSQDLAELVPEFKTTFSQSKIDLSSNASLPLGYEAGHVFGTTYSDKSLNVSKFYSDLSIMLKLYRSVIDRGADTPLDTIDSSLKISDVTEARKYILSRRIERAPNVRKKVFKIKPAICEGCGLDPVLHYSVTKFDLTPLEVHHSKAISHLAEGEERRYKVPDDFMVLCANCHKLIHRQKDSSDLETLRKRITFALPTGKPSDRLF